MRVKDMVLSQLHDYLAWSRGSDSPEPISLLDYVGFVATPDTVFGFAELYSPTLVVHDALHFLASGFSVPTYDAWVGEGRTSEEIQRVMNHVHVSTLLQNQEISDEVALEVARVISEIWSRTLSPEGLEVEAVGECFMDAAVTFFERRDEPARHV